MPRTSIPQFEIGQTYATPAVAEFLANDESAKLLQFHTRGYWDEMDSENISENEISIEKGFRVLTAYTVRGRKIWIITEADRSCTTFLFPCDY
jgi:hypothetical protein